MKRIVAALLVAGGLDTAAYAEEGVLTPGFRPEQTLPSNAPLELRMPRALAAGERLAIFIDRTDVTALFTALPDRLVYRGDDYPLPAGSHEVIVWLVSAEGAWKEIGRFPFKAVSRRGFLKSVVAPAADLTGKGQLAESHRPDQNAPPRSSFHDATMQMTIRTEHERPSFVVRSEGQLTGVTFRNEAIRFNEKQGNAPLVDLSSYRVDLQRKSTVLSIGHLGYGSLRHLVNGFASRGVALKFGEGRPLSLQLAILNGSSIAGWDNFLGLGNDKHRMLGATAGAELIRTRPGALRLEATWFAGSLLPLSGFNQGSVQTADRSRGAGLRLQASTASQRFTIDAGVTGSRFSSAPDDEVESGIDVTPIPSRTRRAQYVDATMVVLRERRLWKRKTATSLTVAARHERIEPLFRSVGVALQSDLQSDGVDITWSLGPFTSQIGHTRTRDNLAGIASILTTKSERTALTLGAPLAAVFGAAGSTALALPIVAVQVDQTHQFSTGVPPNSGFEEVNLPDQKSNNLQATLAWQIGRFQIGYRLGRTLQDNRQRGRERADFDAGTHAFSLGFTPGQRLNVTLELSREENESIEERKRDRTDRLGTNVSWMMFGQTALSGNVSHSLGSNSLGTSSQRGLDGFLELASGFRLARGNTQKRQGRIFLRYADQRARSHDVVFGTRSDRQGATVTSGVTFNPF